MLIVLLVLIYCFILDYIGHSKVQVELLQRQKQVSKSYEYKIRSLLKRKISKLIEKELPLLSELFPNLDLTKFSKKFNSEMGLNHLTNNSKTTNNSNIVNFPTIPHNLENSTRLNHNKLYNCQQDIDQTERRRVRSVVRISQRSSEPCMETVPQTVNSSSESFEIMNELSKSKQQNNSINTQSTVDWEGYREYLTNLNKSKKEIQNKLGYGKTYYYVLESGNAQDLMKVSNGCRVTCYEGIINIIKVYRVL